MSGWGDLGRGFGAEVEEGSGLGVGLGGSNQHGEAAPERRVTPRALPLHNAPNTDTNWVCPRPRKRCFLGSLLLQGALLQCRHQHPHLDTHLVTVAERPTHSGHAQHTTSWAWGTSGPCPFWPSPLNTHSPKSQATRSPGKPADTAQPTPQAKHTDHSDSERNREGWKADPQNPDGQSGH